MSTPVCSIIIRAYNEAAHIGRLLQGIREQTVQDVQVILVDSGSTDDTVRIGESYSVEVVHIPPQEFSFGRSLNLGITQASAELVVMASAHVYPVYPDWLETLLKPFEDDKVALTYGKQRGGETTAFSEHQIFHHWYPDISVHRQDHPFCNNANAAIRRDLWEQHPYDESLPALEDLEWAQWAMEQGHGISYVAEAEIVHLHNQSLAGIYNRYKREAMAFKRLYPQEVFSERDLIRLFLRNVSRDFEIANAQHVLWKHWARIIGFRWRQFYGTFHGYHQSGPLTWQLKKAFYYPRVVEATPQIPKRAVEPIQYHKK
jgi:rhamnosyltransferase